MDGYVAPVKGLEKPYRPSRNNTKSEMQIRKGASGTFLRALTFTHSVLLMYQSQEYLKFFDLICSFNLHLIPKALTMYYIANSAYL